MFPDVQLAAGLAFICSAKTEPGVVNHQCYGSINLANYSCKDDMTDNMTPYSPSMRLDYDFHRRMEIYYLYTRPIEIAREAGCRMPKLEMLEAELRFLEAHHGV